MEDYFYYYLLLSSLVGGGFVCACTLVSERYGTEIGGIIGGFPSTVAVTLFFIGLIESPHTASQATDLIPVIVGFNGLFLVAFALFVRKRLMPGFLGALLLWCVLTFCVIRLGLENFWIALGIYFILLFLSYYLLQYRIRLYSFDGGPIRPTIGRIALRAIFSGAVIATAVWLSNVAGPTVGGIFSVFPAAFISTLLIAYWARGKEFARALTRPMMISGMTNVTIYGICVRYFYPLLGLGWGTLLALIVAAVGAYASYLIIKASDVSVKNYHKRGYVVKTERIGARH